VGNDADAIGHRIAHDSAAGGPFASRYGGRGAIAIYCSSDRAPSVRACWAKGAEGGERVKLAALPTCDPDPRDASEVTVVSPDLSDT
jgi:hypothetical protein